MKYTFTYIQSIGLIQDSRVIEKRNIGHAKTYAKRVLDSNKLLNVIYISTPTGGLDLVRKQGNK